MYITIMDFSAQSITKVVWDIESANTQEVEILLIRMGYNLSNISYMVTENEPHFDGCIEVTDVLGSSEQICEVTNN